jgi:hypothetical protein
MSQMHTNDEDMAQKAAQTARGLKDAGMEALGDAKSKVTQAVSGVAAQAGDHLAQTRDQIADQGERMAESLRDASSRADGSMQTRVLDSMATGLSSVTDMLRNADGTAMVSRVQRFAQRNPVLFATGAAVAGLVIARALAGGSSHASSHDDRDFDTASDRYSRDDAMSSGQTGSYAGSASAPGSLP